MVWRTCLSFQRHRQFRQLYNDRSPLPRSAVNPDGPPVAFDDAFHNGQAQAAALFLGGLKGIEHLFQGFWLNAFAGVLNLNLSAPAVGAGDHGDVEGAALGHGLDGVEQNV
jgi:hypothetical protein